MTDSVDNSDSDRASATAVSASFQDLEDKLLDMLARNHEAQMAEIRSGASEILRKYQDAWSVNLRAFDSEFGRAIAELQSSTHHTANRVQEIVAGLAEEKRDRSKRDNLVDQRLRVLENWRESERKDPGDPCPPASSSTTSR